MKITLKELREIIKYHTSKLLTEAAETQGTYSAKELTDYARDVGYNMMKSQYNEKVHQLIISLLRHYKSLDDNGQYNETRLTENYITAIFDKAFGTKQTRFTLAGVLNKMAEMHGEEIPWLEKVVNKTIRLRKVKPKR